MTRCTPDNVHFVSQGLDHPEGLAFAPDGALIAGGEAGQIYRIDAATGSSRIAAETEGFVLGVCADASGAVYACDAGRNQVLRIDPSGQVGAVSSGRLDNPNDCVLDAQGNLFFTESGAYHPSRHSGRLFVVTRDGRTECLHAGPFRFANGLFLDAGESLLYVVESTAPGVLVFRLDGPRLASEEPIRRISLEPDTVPDGIALDADRNVYVAFYAPDQIGVVRRDGTFAVLYRDCLAEWMNRPTNIALRANEIYFANLGGWHIGAVEHPLAPQPAVFPDSGPCALGAAPAEQPG